MEIVLKVGKENTKKFEGGRMKMWMGFNKAHNEVYDEFLSVIEKSECKKYMCNIEFKLDHSYF